MHAIQNQKFNKVLSVFLCIILVLMLVMGSYIQADAFAIEAGVLLVIATILVGSGLVFGNQDQIVSTATAFWNSMSPQSKDDISGIAGLGMAAFVITEAIRIDLTNFFNTYFSSGSIALPSSKYVGGYDFSWAGPVHENFASMKAFQNVANSIVVAPPDGFEFYLNYFRNYFPYSKFVLNSNGNWNILSSTDGLNYSLQAFVGEEITGVCLITFFNSTSQINLGYTYIKDGKTGSSAISMTDINGFILDAPVVNTPPVTVPTIPGYAPPFEGAPPSDNSLTTDMPLTPPLELENLVDMPVDGVRTGTVNPDIPYEDVGTGEIVGEGGGTGIFEGLGKLLLKIPGLSAILGVLKLIYSKISALLSGLNVLEAIRSLIQSIVDFLVGQGVLTLDGILDNAITTMTDKIGIDAFQNSFDAFNNMQKGHGEPPKIYINLHALVDTAQNVGSFNNGFADKDSLVVDFAKLEEIQFMGMTLIQLIRSMLSLAMISITVFYIHRKLEPETVI